MSKDVLCDKRNTFASLSDDEIHFSWQTQHFGVLHSSCCMAGAALQTCRVACFFANCVVRAASSGDNVQIAWQGGIFLKRVENYFLGFRFGNPFLDILGFHFGNQFLDIVGFHFGNQFSHSYELQFPPSTPCS